VRATTAPSTSMRKRVDSYIISNSWQESDDYNMNNMNIMNNMNNMNNTNNVNNKNRVN
jgi:hypothetical protein